MVALLLDAHNLLYRAFTSLPRAITSADGLPINAVYGMLSYTARLTADFEPEAIVAAFDTPEVPTFRRLKFPGYQAQRGPLGGEWADDFSRQVAIAMEVLPRLDIPAMHVPSYEADDIMGTIAFARAGAESLIVSTDRDLLQMVRPGIRILSPGNPPRIAASDADVRTRMGVDPGGIPTLRALAGDASDNIPGVRGIGMKTAATLVNEYGTLEMMYENLDALKPRVRAALEPAEADAYLYRDIATVRIDVPLQIAVDNLPRPRIAANAKPRQLLSEAGFE